VAIKDKEEERSRSLSASDLRWRTLAMVQGPTLRGRVEVFMQDGKSSEGWSPWTTPPGDEGARHRVILRLLVDPRRFGPPDQQDQLRDSADIKPAFNLVAGQHDSSTLVRRYQTELASSP
jgi:hypothetical protein